MESLRRMTIKVALPRLLKGFMLQKQIDGDLHPLEMCLAIQHSCNMKQESCKKFLMQLEEKYVLNMTVIQK